MTTTAIRAATGTAQSSTHPATSARSWAIAAGVLYLVTHVTSVSARLLFGPAIDRGGSVVGAQRLQVLTGGVLEMVLAVAVVGTAVALHPVITRQAPGLAAGYVGLRTLEASIIVAGVVMLLAAVTIGDRGPVGDPATVAVVQRGLVTANEWAFLLGPGLVCSVNTVVLASLLWRTRLVPRVIAGLGLAGGAFIALSNGGVLFGQWPQVSVITGLAALPAFAWELSLALYLLLRGFRPLVPGATTRRDASPAGLVPTPALAPISE